MPRPLENPERKEGESLFSLALEARCECALMRLRIVADEIGSDAFNQHHAEAYRLAARASMRSWPISLEASRGGTSSTEAESEACRCLETPQRSGTVKFYRA